MPGIHLVMPMGGGGTRFSGRGFHMPKPLIELQGRPFFYWAAQSVVKQADVADIIFVVLQEHIDRFGIDRRIREYYPGAKIQVIPHVLNGAVLTCLEGIRMVGDSLPVLFNDCDHAFACSGFARFCREQKPDSADGALLTFRSDNPAFSYVKYDEKGNVAGTVEKRAVSDRAVCGAYYFKNKEVFSRAADTYLEKCGSREFFVSGVYNVMAERNRKIVTFATDWHISFGTPDEYGRALGDKRLGVLR